MEGCSESHMKTPRLQRLGTSENDPRAQLAVLKVKYARVVQPANWPAAGRPRPRTVGQPIGHCSVLSHRVKTNIDFVPSATWSMYRPVRINIGHCSKVTSDTA